MISGTELVLLLVVTLEVLKFALHIYGVFKERTTIKVPRLELLKWYVCIAGISLIGLVVVRTSIPYLDHIIVLISLILTGLAYPFAQIIVRRCRDSGWPKLAAYMAAAPYIGGIVILLLLFWKPTSETTESL